MEDSRKAFGRRGEEIAAAFLRSKGFRVIAENWRCRMGEIDLIVERNGEVRFVEVKLRHTKAYGHPEEAITPAKLRHLSAAIECWLRVCPQPPMHYQIDAIAISLERGKTPDLRWIEGVF